MNNLDVQAFNVRLSLCTDKPPVIVREVVAAPGHGIAAVGFGLALAAQTLASDPRGALLLWVREAAATTETGDAYGPGLAGFGLSPDCILIVETRTHLEALRAALEGARCEALGAVVVETMAPIDLTASRRLKLAAEKSGVAIVLVRLGGQSVPNAAQVRWRVQAAPEVAKPDGTRCAAFELAVLKSTTGFDGRSGIVEWDHERLCFAQTLSLPVDALSGIGPMAA
ncbi:hypothetical protein [Hyphomicrobium sp.]|uniref:ImuA family protein n=1 Tax=Hyphomicrobium sp. TaxID=82 RepID=UPI002E35BB6B|nr:hypothetical protein [Hyphomicrobium sp.]HEX2843140.1 hypothetical protein [Hyphomicrobium sp.]